MSTEQMRAAILSAYPGWYYKLKSASDHQIYAIYTRLLGAKKL